MDNLLNKLNKLPKIKDSKSISVFTMKEAPKSLQISKEDYFKIIEEGGAEFVLKKPFIYNKHILIDKDYIYRIQKNSNITLEEIKDRYPTLYKNVIQSKESRLKLYKIQKDKYYLTGGAIKPTKNCILVKSFFYNFSIAFSHEDIFNAINIKTDNILLTYYLYSWLSSDIIDEYGKYFNFIPRFKNRDKILWRIVKFNIDYLPFIYDENLSKVLIPAGKDIIENPIEVNIKKQESLINDSIKEFLHGR